MLNYIIGAVNTFLTILKHKNTIICLQIFKKHAKLTYLFSWKTMLQSVILLWKCAFRAGMSASVLVCVTRPLPVYPIVFRHPRLPVGGKHSTFNLIHRHLRSFLLVSLIWQPACASSLRRRGRVKKKLSNILNLDCNTWVNPTYSTTNSWNSSISCFGRKGEERRAWVGLGPRILISCRTRAGLGLSISDKGWARA